MNVLLKHPNFVFMVHLISFESFLGRIPVITFVHRQDKNDNQNHSRNQNDNQNHSHDIVIARSGQPLVGPFMRYNQSDEMLIDAIRILMKIKRENDHQDKNETEIPSNKDCKKNLKGGIDCILNIIDARPSLNAYANMLRGKGTENLDRYSNCNRIFIAIDNIHSVRASFYKLLKGIKSSQSITSKELLEYWEGQCYESGWTKHKRSILEGVAKIISLKSSCLVHCSDGWDRASQLISLVEICMDSHYRTVPGLKCIILKEWFAFGHRFRNRQSKGGNGAFIEEMMKIKEKNNKEEIGENVEKMTRMENEKNCINKKDGKDGKLEKKINFIGNDDGGGGDGEFSPIFPLFLDCLYTLIRWFPDAFSYDQRLLLELWDESFMGKDVIWGNSELERNGNMIKKETLEWWQGKEEEYSNKKIYNRGIISPPLLSLTNEIASNEETIPCWIELFCRIL